MKNLKFEF
jgi:hypothetical protein